MIWPPQKGTESTTTHQKAKVTVFTSALSSMVFRVPFDLKGEVII